jgi:hypothetical protein
MAWEAASTTISNAVSVTGTTYGDSSSVVSLNPGELCQLYVYSDTNGTTDDLIVGIFPTEDGGTTYPTVPAQTFTVPYVSDPDSKPFLVSGWSAFKLMYKGSGATDTFTVTTKARKDGVSA